MDLKWPEMPSKVNFGHPKWPINLKWPGMRSKVIYRHPKWPPGKKFCIDLKWPELRSKVNFGNPKWPIYLKWPEMRSKVNFGHPKWPTAAILSKISKQNYSCVSIWNGQKCDRMWISDIQNGWRQLFRQKIPKKLKLCIDLKWPEMGSKVKFGHPKWPMSAILSKISKKNKVAYRCEMDRNEIESDFRTSKMATGSHFVKKI